MFVISLVILVKIIFLQITGILRAPWKLYNNIRGILFSTRPNDKSILMSFRATKQHDSVLICMIARKRDKLSAPSRPAQFASTNFPQLRQSRSVQGSVFFIFSLFLPPSPSLFCAARCSSGKRARDEEGRKGARALLINYSVGVAPLKIKIGSLSGATWNFFLNRQGGGGGRRRRLPVFYLSWRKVGPRWRRPTSMKRGNSTRSFVRIGKASIPCSALMAPTRPRRFLFLRAINASLTIAPARNNRSLRLTPGVLLRRHWETHPPTRT